VHLGCDSCETSSQCAGGMRMASGAGGRTVDMLYSLYFALPSQAHITPEASRHDLT